MQFLDSIGVGEGNFIKFGLYWKFGMVGMWSTAY